jgi:hypothetical protein
MVIGGCGALFLLAWVIRPKVDNYFKKQTLIATYKDYRLLNEREAYQKYYSPKDKNLISYDEIMKRRSVYLPLEWKDYVIEDAVIDGDSGHIRSVETYCNKEQCKKNKTKKITLTIWFQYINNQWYLDVFHSDCIRDKPFSLPSEFERALSLITQRFKDSPRAEDQEFGKIFSSVKNCLDIQYAPSEKVMDGAEDLFYFQDDSPTDHLTIQVSPRYKYKDDLTTSLLLVHELYHASLRSHKEDIMYSCFDNEAYAHTIAYSFFFMLNQDEQNSLSTRYFAGTSPELQGYFDTNKKILAMPGNDLAKKFQDYVKSNKYYQNQCKEI